MEWIIAVGFVILGVAVSRLHAIEQHLKGTHDLLTGELKRQRDERLLEDGRDSQGRFARGRQVADNL
jgi:hypothetical protein